MQRIFKYHQLNFSMIQLNSGNPHFHAFEIKINVRIRPFPTFMRLFQVSAFRTNVKITHCSRSLSYTRLIAHTLHLNTFIRQLKAPRILKISWFWNKCIAKKFVMDMENTHACNSSNRTWPISKYNILERGSLSINYISSRACVFWAAQDVWCDSSKYMKQAVWSG